ncbi:AAA family ATPase [Streptomyces sp. GMY02]|uniref:helix-turn-helix transcriptional regulator n=1 Tax=Streptomyces sp. GMY02 TaxID=1333528 RepID=UPI001C2C583D|nr:LuxR family transcriptional regulator [Streptomyces sp. GMY02]QXE33239.1 AAA family ATPase [Streptomyces sp. GMY02]
MTRLVERDEQLSRLAALLGQARSGTGGIALVEGKAATGKTDLLHSFARSADDAFSDGASEAVGSAAGRPADGASAGRGPAGDRSVDGVVTVRVTADSLVVGGESAVGGALLQLHAICSPAEQALPLGVVSQLFLAPALPAAFRARAAELIDRLASAPGTGATERLTAQVLHGLCVELLALVDRSPALITVDDVQHADPESVLWLLYLARRIAPAPVLVVLASDVGPHPGFQAARTELLRYPHSDVITVGRLSQEGTAELIGHHLGPSAAQRLTPAFFGASGGNPLLLNALLEDWRTGRTMAGHAYRRALLTSVRRGGPTGLAVVRGLAVLGEHASEALLSRLVGMNVDVVAETVRTFEAAGLLSDGGFAHPNGRAGVLDDMPPQQRAGLHRTVARLLQERGEPATAVAAHIIAGEGADGIATTRVLRDAAESHLLEQRFSVAVDCLEQALRSSRDGRERAAIRARLAQVEWRSDPRAAARHLEPLVGDARAGVLAPGDVIEVCLQLLWQGRGEEAAALTEKLRAAPDDAPADTGARLRAFELWLMCTHPRPVRRRRPVLRGQSAADGPAERTAPWQQFSEVLADVLIHRRYEEATERAEQLLHKAGLQRGPVWTGESALLCLMPEVYADRMAQATRWCEVWRHDPWIARVPMSRAELAAVSAEIAVRRGDLAAAVERARAALEEVSVPAWGTAVGLPLSSLILAATRTGQVRTAAEYLRVPVPASMFESRYGLHYLYARGHYHLACDNHTAALADFFACGELMRSWSLDTPGLVPWRTGAAEAWLRQGNREQARRLLNEQLAGVGTDFGRVRGQALRLLAACGSERRRTDLLGDAVEVLEGTGDRYELAWALADLSRAHHASGEHRRARQTARRAWYVARGCQAEPLCGELFPGMTDNEVGGPGSLADTALGFLSRAERRVATLASAGYTNHAIARKLFITESTVEQHLTKVYRKLNVKHREELPALLHHDTATSA